MSLLLAGALISGGTALVKGITGAVQASKANKGIKRLMANQPTYKRPEEYNTLLAMRQRLAAQGQLPGYGYLEDNIGQATSTALQESKVGAISSGAYQKSVGDIFSKQMQAYQDLALQSAQWQDRQKEGLAEAYKIGAEYSDTEWEQNKLRPWEMKMNQMTSQKQAGTANMWEGIQGVGSSIMDFAGTKYSQDIMKKLMGGKA